MNNILKEKLNYLKNSRVKSAMEYSLLAGGKRLRPKLLYGVVKGFSKNVEDLDNIACAIEMIHTYSLIHDDLPSMDNDDYRRGMKTCHIEFDEATAILAGDGLLTEAFYLISKANISSDKIVKCISILSAAAGCNGMIYGQELDMFFKDYGNDFNYLKDVHKHKTGMLISAPLKIGCILSDKEELLSLFEEIGYKMGLAFQIHDDILDYTCNEKELGKSNSDIKNNKLTSINTIGIEEAVKLKDKLYDECINILKGVNNFNSNDLIELILNTKNRKK